MGKSEIDNIPKPYYKVPVVPEHLKHLPNRVSENLIGKTIFISGGSGFLGKVLIEKILRKCPEVNRIYLLMRTKKGKDPKQRIEELFTSPIFDLLKTERGNDIIKKVFVIPGDVMEADGMGISQENVDVLRESIQVVFHVAATIRFDEPIRKAVLLNTRGTKQMLELATKMTKLELFMHVSTSYCHLQEKVLEEKVYPPAADPESIITCCELLSEDLIEEIGKTILKNFPNSYAFTKNLSEGLVVKYMNKGLPCLMVRPSIVIPVWLEPLPGWTDNINGPVGMLIGAGKGVIRTMYCNNSGYADYLPVDICVNAILISAWTYMKKLRPETIYNLTSSSEWQVTWQELIDVGRDIILKDIPLNNAIWYPGGTMKRSRLLHQICVLLFHMIPAYFLDAIIYLAGHKPLLVRIQDRINKGFEVFEYYGNNQWDFKNDNLVSLRPLLNERETIEYRIDGREMEKRHYFCDCILAARLYILKETPDTIPAARRHMWIMHKVDIIAKFVFLCLMLWFFTSWSGTFMKIIYSIFHLMEHVLHFFTSDSSSQSVRQEL